MWEPHSITQMSSSATSTVAQAKPKYIVVSGAREWPMKNYILIARYFAKQAAQGKFVLIEGECRGVDLQARRAAEQLGMKVLPMPPEWGKFRQGAGPKRNTEMLELLIKKRDEGHPIGVVWFHENLAESKGTKDLVAKAEKLGLAPVNGGAQ